MTAQRVGIEQFQHEEADHAAGKGAHSPNHCAHHTVEETARPLTSDLSFVFLGGGFRESQIFRHNSWLIQHFPEFEGQGGRCERFLQQRHAFI